MTTPPRGSTGGRIRERRLALNIRQGHLAAKAGISASYLNLIEHNRRPIGGALLTRLADALKVSRAALSAEVDESLLDALRAAGAAQDLPAEELSTAAELARRYPAWAAVIAAQSERLAAQGETIAALSDRLSHDPALAEAMHELLSTVSVVRSTASILAQTPELDANWLRRFHTNLDDDSRRLADGAEAVVSYLDRTSEGEGEARLTPSEIVARFLDAHDHAFPALEAGGVDAIPSLVATLPGEEAQALATAVLTSDAEDAARLPLASIQTAQDPDDLLHAAHGDTALVLRRLGVTDPARGLVICDASGALIRRKPVAGFGLPVIGAGCPLWPLYEALSQPGRALVRRLELPDGATWTSHAVAMPLPQTRFDTMPTPRATMLLTRAVREDTSALPVGPGCRICPRAACPARREPSVLPG
ncbi:short-chain fatty acyl-CoA regulator family protein [Jannaschia sp.]|nr:short-chain fatty acyl-CoA regulator family protein [Jannaschia sp.]